MNIPSNFSADVRDANRDAPLQLTSLQGLTPFRSPAGDSPVHRLLAVPDAQTTPNHHSAAAVNPFSKAKPCFDTLHIVAHHTDIPPGDPNQKVVTV
jgi:hypothetical protein